MSDVKWIKIVTDIFDDEKILLIESLPENDSIIVIWFKLLCFAGKQNNNGVFMMNNRIAYTDEMLATIFRRPLNTVRLALKTFEEYGMIEIVNNAITIPNWEKHQNLDKLEKIRDQGKKRVREYRERQKAIAAKENCNVNCNVTDSVTVTQCNATDIDKDIDIDKENNIYGDENVPQPKKKPTKRFKKPTLEEVKAYCLERKNNVDAEKFIDYYESNGWRVGKNPMSNWKAAVRTWERNNYGGYKNGTGYENTPDYSNEEGLI